MEVICRCAELRGSLQVKVRPVEVVGDRQERVHRGPVRPVEAEVDGLRLVHVCWSTRAISTIAARRPDGRLQEEDLGEVAGKQTPFARAVDLLLTGPELKLREGVGFHDAHGHYRTSARIAWWRADARSWRDAALSVPDPAELPDEPVKEFAQVEFYDPREQPVLVGHYKMRGAPGIEAPHAACLDYPDTPVVYRWSGEKALRHEGIVRVG